MQSMDTGLEFLKKYDNVKPMKRSEIAAALDFILRRIDSCLDFFTDQFPCDSSEHNIYGPQPNIGWTNGFWTGMLWLAYQYSGDERYRRVAQRQCKSFRERIEKQIELEHHDLGFLYTPSCVAGYMLTQNEEMKETAVMAANKLITRYKEKGGFIQAWGALDDPEAYRLIIDCYMNLSLLYWVSEITGERKYAAMAEQHAKTAAETVIREDFSTFHTYYFDINTGCPLRGVTHQGYSNDSAWARGQAWGIYGLALSYKHTRDTFFLEKCVQVTNYFLAHLPQDDVAYWDLIFTDGSGQERDSSAAAIAVGGLLEYIQYDSGPWRKTYENAAHAILRSLSERYTTADIPESNGILKHATYAKPQGSGVDECNIWGDYYYMESLLRLYRDWESWW